MDIRHWPPTSARAIIPSLPPRNACPGTWTFVDSIGDNYGRVRIVRIGDEVGFIAELGPEPVGRYLTLRAGLEAVHRALVHAHAPGEAPNGGTSYVLGR